MTGILFQARNGRCLQARKKIQWELIRVGGHFILTLALVLLTPAARAATNDFFAQATEFNRAGEFSAAAAALQKEIKLQPSAGALLNLGLAEWQGGRAGAAILAWERVKWIDPFDARAQQNLKFARAVVQVDEPELKWHEIISTWLPPNVWLWLAGSGLWLAVGAAVLPRVFRWRKSGGQQALAALGFGLFIFALTANVGVVSRTNLGVVLKKNAVLQLTPTRDGEVVAALAAGEPGRRIKERGMFYFIRTATTAGWVARESFGLINE